MLSIEEIKLLIEKLEKVKKEDLQTLIDSNLQILKDIELAVDANNREIIDRLDKTPDWFRKDLDQKKLKPTQERLGVSYIERDEDDIDLDDPDADALFKTFQSAGYAGTQEEFYETFMPDADRGDIQLITQGMSGLTLNIGDMSDPFEALGSLSSFLGDGDGTDIFGMETKEEKKEESNYFDLFADEKEEDYASPTGRGFIDDFTSFFK